MYYSNAARFLLCAVPLDDPEREKQVVDLYPHGHQTLISNNIRLDSGVDIPTPKDVVVPPKEKIRIDLVVGAVCLRLYHKPPIYGQVIHNIEPNEFPWAFYLCARSSITKTPLILVNSIGIIDVSFRESLVAVVLNQSDYPYIIKKGTALFQLICPDLSPPEFEFIRGNDDRAYKYFNTTMSARGSFGSTGIAGSATKKKAESKYYKDTSLKLYKNGSSDEEY